MGFHIKINESSERMLSTLKTSPEEIFQSRYHCYLLFLVGASDDEAMNWLVKNVVSLDSLTGAEIAFGIFMKNLRIPLETNSEPVKGKPVIAASIPIEGFKAANTSTERIIKNHLQQHVYNGDEVVAITYATDIVAREFRVLDRLPCMLLLDPIPFGNVQVVQLTNVVCNHLINIIRRSVYKYLYEKHDKPNAFSYTSAILDAQNSLDEWEHKGELLVKRIEKMNDDLARLKGMKSSETGVDHIRGRLELARLHLAKGAARKTRIALLGGSFRNYHTSNGGLPLDNNVRSTILQFLEKECTIIKQCNDTIFALTGYLDEGEITYLGKERLESIYAKYIVSILHLQEGEGRDIDKAKVKRWIEQLENEKVALITRFDHLLPDIDKIEKNIQDEYQRKNYQLIDKLQSDLLKVQVELTDHTENYVAKKKQLEALLDESIRLYQKNDPVTFSSTFVKEVRSLKMDGYLSQTKFAGGKFAESIFKPDTILKILDFISKMTG
jgi:hypothetical protein